MTKRTITAFVLIAAATFGVSACGSSSKSPTPAGSDVGTQVPATPATPTTPSTPATASSGGGGYGY